MPKFVYDVWRGSGEPLAEIQRNWSVDDLVRVSSYLMVEYIEKNPPKK